jgi:Lon protease-like protein
MNEDKAALQAFSGTARLFPLPNLVFFPHALQPLHIFEPRYRQMVGDALASDKLFAIALLRSESEKASDSHPPVHQVACLGRILADQRLPDGRYNLLLRGLSRVRIIEEVPIDKLYRAARMELIADTCTASLETVMELRKQLAEHILPRFGKGSVADQLNELFHSELSLGALCDVLTFALPVPIEWKQMMLEEPNEEVRAEKLLQGFEKIAPSVSAAVAQSNRKFPPDFSSN